MPPTRTRRALLAASLLALLSACAQGATAKGMIVTPADLRSAPNPALAGAVSVAEVGGGRETNPMWTSQIDAASFREALVESLRGAGLLAEKDGAPLALQVRIVALDQPLVGFDMTVTSVVRYTVREVRTGAVLLDEDVTAAHRATVGDAFVGSKRLRLANEGSARKNIAALLERLNAIRVEAAAVPGS